LFPEGATEGGNEGFPADMPAEALAGTLRARNAFAAPTPAQAQTAALDPLISPL